MLRQWLEWLIPMVTARKDRKTTNIYGPWPINGDTRRVDSDHGSKSNSLRWEPSPFACCTAAKARNAFHVVIETDDISICWKELVYKVASGASAQRATKICSLHSVSAFWEQLFHVQFLHVPSRCGCPEHQEPICESGHQTTRSPDSNKSAG